MKRLLCMVLALLCLSGCARAASGETMRAMAARLPGGGLLLVRLDGEPAPISAKLPEQILDENGSVIPPDALQSGDVLEITGDGLLAESWPAQYPGVTAARVLSRGSEADLAPYREALAGLLPEEARDEPPALTLRWEGGSAQASMGNYHWQRDNDDGTTTAAIACGPHVLRWCPIAQIESPGAVTLAFAQPVPGRVEAERWPDALYRTDDPTVDGERVPVEKSAEGGFSIDADPGYIYLLKASWDGSSAEYGFLTLKPEENESELVGALTSELESKGFSVVRESAEPQILTGKRHLLTLGGASNGILTIYEYEDAASAQADARCIDSSGCTVALEGEAHSVEWKSVPRFYRKDNLILQYVGTNEMNLETLAKRFGNQFAGGQTP